MSDTAIRVESLSKLYRIGRAQRRHDTLRDALVAGLRRNRQSTDATDLWALATCHSRSSAARSSA